MGPLRSSGRMRGEYRVLCALSRVPLTLPSPRWKEGVQLRSLYLISIRGGGLEQPLEQVLAEAAVDVEVRRRVVDEVQQRRVARHRGDEAVPRLRGARMQVDG